MQMDPRFDALDTKQDLIMSRMDAMDDKLERLMAQLKFKLLIGRSFCSVISNRLEVPPADLPWAMSAEGMELKEHAGESKEHVEDNASCGI